METIGWIGAILFSICAIPQAWASHKQGHSNGIDKLFIWTWFGGEVCMIIYSIHLMKLPLLTNYIFNFVCLVVIIYYMYFPREEQ